MYNISKLVALILAFSLGVSVGAGALVGGIAIALGTFTVRDLERNGVPIPDEAFIGENPEVDLLDLNALELFDEIKALQSFGDDVTVDFIQGRYALILPEKLESLISDEARNTPIKHLLSKDGLSTLLSTIYIGNIENYTCLNADGTEGGDPKDETSYWVNAEGKKISGIEEIIADFTLDDFVSGNINTSSLLHGEIVLADVLGYNYNEELGAWFDGDNNKVTGVMAVFADCTLDNISGKINTVEIGDLIGYTKGEDGKWYSENENGAVEAVNGFMSKIAENSIDSIDTVFDSLEIGDIVSEEDRTGIFSIIPADTKIDEIGTAVNDSIMKSPLQFFINEDLISFTITDEATNTEKKMDVVLDTLSANDFVTIYSDAEDFETQKGYYGSIWTEVKNGAGQIVAYTVPTWRTQPLSSSFAYIINLLTPAI